MTETREKSGFFYYGEMAALATVVTIYLQTIVYAFNFGKVLYFGISITAILQPSFFLILLPAFLITAIILILRHFSMGRKRRHPQSPFRERFLIAVVTTVLGMALYVLTWVLTPQDKGAELFPASTGARAFTVNIEAALVLCFPMLLALLFHALERYIFRASRNPTSISMTTVIIFLVLAYLLTVFLYPNYRFTIMQLIMQTILQFDFWIVANVLRARNKNDERDAVRTQRTRDAQNGGDFLVLLVLICLLPVTAGFTGYSYAETMNSFKVFRYQDNQYSNEAIMRDQGEPNDPAAGEPPQNRLYASDSIDRSIGAHAYAVVFENETMYYTVRCHYERWKQGAEWYDPEKDVLFLEKKYSMAIEKNAVIVERETYDVVSCIETDYDTYRKTQ